MTEEDIEAAMRDDPDWADLIDFDWSTAKVIEPGEDSHRVEIELDAEVYALLSKRGALEPQINGILRRFLERVRRRDAAE